MNWKKTLALSLAALAVAGAISGCGGDKKDAKAPAEKKEITVALHRVILKRLWNLWPRKQKNRASR